VARVNHELTVLGRFLAFPCPAAVLRRFYGWLPILEAPRWQTPILSDCPSSCAASTGRGRRLQSRMFVENPA